MTINDLFLIKNLPVSDTSGTKFIPFTSMVAARALIALEWSASEGALVAGLRR